MLIQGQRQFGWVSKNRRYTHLALRGHLSKIARLQQVDFQQRTVGAHRASFRHAERSRCSSLAVVSTGFLAASVGTGTGGKKSGR
jgi:hypothetical protein